MKAKAFRFHITERANNHIKQGDPLFFAHYPIGITNDRLPAMLTNAIHNLRLGAKNMPWPRSHTKSTESNAFQQVLIFISETKAGNSTKDEMKSIRFVNFCEQFFYNGSLVTS